MRAAPAIGSLGAGSSSSSTSRAGVGDARDKAAGNRRERRDLLAAEAADMPRVGSCRCRERRDECVVAAASEGGASAELELTGEEAADDDRVADGGDRAQAVEVEAADRDRGAFVAGLAEPHDDTVAGTLGDELRVPM